MLCALELANNLQIKEGFRIKNPEPLVVISGQFGTDVESSV